MMVQGCFFFIKIHFIYDEILKSRIIHFLTGVRIVYNMTNESLNRVASIDTSELDNTKTITYVPLDPNKYYRCISNSYLTKGGDAFDMIPKTMKNHRSA